MSDLSITLNHSVLLSCYPYLGGRRTRCHDLLFLYVKKKVYIYMYIMYGLVFSHFTRYFKMSQISTWAFCVFLSYFSTI